MNPLSICYQPMDRHSFGTKFFFIFRHHVSRGKWTAMQIIGYIFYVPGGRLLDRFQRVIKKVTVIGFKANSPVLVQNDIINGQKKR